MKKFNVGDIIIFRNKKSMYMEEVGREQIITSISGDNYHTIFLDTMVHNTFLYDCDYVSNCEYIRNDGNYILNNGIPMVWENEV
jgi:hypothetical protein